MWYFNFKVNHKAGKNKRISVYYEAGKEQNIQNSEPEVPDEPNRPLRFSG